MAAGRREPQAWHPGRVELDRKRALRRTDAVRDAQGRQRLPGRRLRMVRRRWPEGPRLHRQAPATRAGPGAERDGRLPLRLGGAGMTVSRDASTGALAGLRVVDASTLFA